jgi:hypothetical protein
MLVIVEGDQGAGKTLMAVRRFLITVKRRPAMQGYGPFDVDHPNWHKVGWAELLDPAAPPGFFIWDEAVRAVDSRRSMSLPASVTQGATEERKSARDVWVIVQDISMADSRLRTMATEIKSVRGILPTKRKYSKQTDEIIRREHPRFVIVKTWRGRTAHKMDPKFAHNSIPLPWAALRKYADRYDTTATVELAGHIAAGKDFYRDEREAVNDAEQDPRGGSRPDAGVRPRRQPAPKPSPVRASRDRGGAAPDVRVVPGGTTRRAATGQRSSGGVRPVQGKG